MTDIFFQSPNEKMWLTSCEILVASAKFLVSLGTGKVQFPTLITQLKVNLLQEMDVLSEEYVLNMF